jgi:hypothetical protein
MQAGLQASENGGKLSACLQLPVGGHGLPEALEGLCEVGFFAVQTVGFF